MNGKSFVLAVYLCAFFLMLGAARIQADELNPEQLHEAGLIKSKDCEAYKSLALDTAAPQLAELRYGSPPVALAAATSESGSGGGGNEFTNTNIQEAGVDELDIVKNDDKYFYIVNNAQFYIIQAWPPKEMKQVARIELAAGAEESSVIPYGLFLEGDKVIVLSRSRRTAIGKRKYSKEQYPYGHPTLVLNFIDVSDKSNIKLKERLEFPAYYVDSRLIEGKLLLAMEYTDTGLDLEKYVMADIPSLPPAYRKRPAEKKRTAIVKKSIPSIRAYLAKETKDWNDEAFLPTASLRHQDGKESVLPFVSCQDFYNPKLLASKREGFFTLLSLDINDPTTLYSSTMVNLSWLFYASQNNVYLAKISRRLVNNDRMKNDDSPKMLTQIHQFAIEENAKIQYVASGEIKGYVKSRFWINQYKDTLRVASQRSFSNPRRGSSAVSILKRLGNHLVEIGRIDGIAPGEHIYAVRMMGEKGYVVTFKRTDPLYTLDFSAPNAPKILGELKINGYSSYIHPIDDKHLLTIGEDATDQGRVTGLHLQIFDVSDATAPKRVQHELVSPKNEGNGKSEALHNHHAFSYHAPSQTLVIPLMERKKKSLYEDPFDGVLVYKVSPSQGFERIGRIDHRNFVADNNAKQPLSLKRSRIYFREAGVYNKDA
ncbi:MAG: beta-propeller domain-containing protein [Bradymonadales bacterium]|jgi:uncharacterized secreted protein with C-terminal beta-propeller domain